RYASGQDTERAAAQDGNSVAGLAGGDVERLAAAHGLAGGDGTVRPPAAVIRQVEYLPEEILPRIEMHLGSGPALDDLQYVARQQLNGAAAVEPQGIEIDMIASTEAADHIGGHIVEEQPPAARERDWSRRHGPGVEHQIPTIDCGSAGRSAGKDNLAATAVDGRADGGAAGADILQAAAVDGCADGRTAGADELIAAVDQREDGLAAARDELEPA